MIEFPKNIDLRGTYHTPGKERVDIQTPEELVAYGVSGFPDHAIISTWGEAGLDAYKRAIEASKPTAIVEFDLSRKIEG